MSAQPGWICSHCQKNNSIKAPRCTICFQPRSPPNKSNSNKGIYPSLSKPGAGSNSILKKGSLQKKGKGMFDGWSTRYFILKQDGDFAYYSDRSCKNWKGNIDLQTVSKIVRKDNKNLVLHTAQRKWYLLSNNKNELDHWQQLLLYICATEKNKKRKKQNIMRKPKKPPPPLPQLQQSHSDNRWSKQDQNDNNNNNAGLAYRDEGSDNKNNKNNNNNKHHHHHHENQSHPHLYLPAFNPAFVDNVDAVDDDKKDNKDKDDKKENTETIQYYYDEGSSPAYLGKDVKISETQCYKTGYLCIWRIAEEVLYGDDDVEDEQNDNEDEEEEEEKEEKQTLQILMGTRNIENSKKKELSIFGGDRSMSDHTPIECAIRSFRVQTAEILDATVCGQIKQSLSTSNDRQMFWSGNNNKSVTYFYNMDYDYEMIEMYRKYQRIDDLYFTNLYWVNWQEIYKYSILYSDPEPLVINKEKYEINETVSQLMVTNDVASYFHSIMTEHGKKKKMDEEKEKDDDDNNNNNNNDVVEDNDDNKDADKVNDDEIENDEFDPYGLASAPKMSIATDIFNSNGDQNKKYKWQWFDGDTKFEDFDSECNEKIENAFLVNPMDLFFVHINNIKYKINLKESTQRNTATNTVRLLRRVSIEDIEDNKYESVFASNGNILSYNPEWKIKKKKNNKVIRFEYMNKNGEWKEYDKDLSQQIQFASLTTVKYEFTSNKGQECQINFELMEERNIETKAVRPIRKIDVEHMMD